MHEYVSYYLWRGVDAIEDLEDCHSFEEALRELRRKVLGDWTLWRRQGYNAQLVAVYLTGNNVFQQFAVAGVVAADKFDPDDWRPERNL